MTSPGARKEPRWIRFDENPALGGPKTRAWDVVSKDGEHRPRFQSSE
jgi:hypothetical protein